MTSAPLDGPRLPAASGRARQLVVFLHGYGADGNDLIELGAQWAGLLPDAAFVAPHAPERCAMSPMGRQWFGLTMRDPNAVMALGPRAIGLQPHPEFIAPLSAALLDLRVDLIGAERVAGAHASLDRPLDRGLIATWIVNFLRG